MELERLYFRLNADALDFSAGLMRLPLGYSQVFGPMDYLNPRNPLVRNARPRAVLGAAASFFPWDSEFKVFAAAGQGALALSAEGLHAGLLWSKDWDSLSLQALYAYSLPSPEAGGGLHRAGLSVKADAVLGFTGELLYTADPERNRGAEGLSASLGADYSFFDGSLLILFEYLYNGRAGLFAAHHYLSVTLNYQINDYTSLAFAGIVSLEDPSCTPTLSFSYDLFQGAILTLAASFPLDLFGAAGEFGPERIGSWGSLDCGLRLRF
jgi:hypothetical protein